MQDKRAAHTEHPQPDIASNFYSAFMDMIDLLGTIGTAYICYIIFRALPLPGDTLFPFIHCLVPSSSLTTIFGVRYYC